MANGGQQSGDVLGGVMGLGLLFWVGSCVFGGSDEPAAPVRAETAADAAVNRLNTVANEIERNGAARDAKALTGEDTGRVDYDDLDEADRAIRLAINLSGNLCAKPILVSPMALAGKYAVTCITNRTGRGRSRYIVDSGTQEVVPVS